jgi:hypothetical protein
MPRVPLRETAVVTLDGSGAGTAKVGPLSAREVWYPDNVATSVTGFTKQANTTMYMGSDTTQSNFRDVSTFGSGDSSGACNADTIKCGMWIWAVWLNGDAGKQAILTVTGLKDV